MCVCVCVCVCELCQFLCGMAVIGSWWQLAMQAAACQVMQPFKPPFQACLQLGMAPRAKQGVQLMPLQPQAWQVQPEPTWLPERVH